MCIKGDGKKERPLTAQQMRFVEAYNGNGSEAAIAAGYSAKAADKQASRMMLDERIARAVHEREAKRLEPMIADRAQRQAFWSNMMQDEERTALERLKASELLGKSCCDFSERRIFEGSQTNPVTFNILGLSPTPAPAIQVQPVQLIEQVIDGVLDDDSIFD